MHPSSPVAAAGISIMAVLLSVFFVCLVDRAAPRLAPPERRRRVAIVAGATALWLALLALAGLSGALAQFELRPPPLAFLMFGCIAGGLALGLSRVGGWLSSGLPLWLLVGWQAFRLPLELLIHRAAEDGVAPSALSYSGYNFDILTGSSALVLSVLLARLRVPRLLVLAWNALGIAALLTIVGIAVLTAPFVRALGEGQINSWVASFPYVWLPGVMVVSAIAGHVAVSRRLLSEARAQRPPLDHQTA
jgi:hypothetical protein